MKPIEAYMEEARAYWVEKRGDAGVFTSDITQVALMLFLNDFLEELESLSSNHNAH